MSSHPAHIPAGPRTSSLHDSVVVGGANIHDNSSNNSNVLAEHSAEHEQRTDSRLETMLASVRDNTTALGLVLDGIPAPTSELHPSQRPLDHRPHAPHYYQHAQHDRQQQRPLQRSSYPEIQSHTQQFDFSRQRNGQHNFNQQQQQQQPLHTQHTQQYNRNRVTTLPEDKQPGHGSGSFSTRPSAVGQTQYNSMGLHLESFHDRIKPPLLTAGVVPNLNLKPSPDNTYPPPQQAVITPPLSATTPAGTPAQHAQSSAGWFGASYSLQSRPPQADVFEQYSDRRHDLSRPDSSTNPTQQFRMAPQQYQRQGYRSADQEQMQLHQQEEPLNIGQMPHMNQRSQQQQAFVNTDHMSFPGQLEKNSIEQEHIPQNLSSSALETQSGVQLRPQDTPFDVGPSKERHLEQLNMLTGQIRPGSSVTTPFVSKGTGLAPSSYSSLAPNGPPLSHNMKSEFASRFKRPRASAQQGYTGPDAKRTRGTPMNAGKIRELLQENSTEVPLRNQYSANEDLEGNLGQYPRPTSSSAYVQPGTTHPMQGEAASIVPLRESAGESRGELTRNDEINSTLIARLRNFKPGQGPAGLTTSLGAQAILGITQPGIASVPLTSSMAMRVQPDLMPGTAGNSKQAVANADMFQRPPFDSQEQLGFGVMADSAGPSGHQNFCYPPAPDAHQRLLEDYAADPQFGDSSSVQIARPYRCKFCPSTFGRRDNMQKHMRIIHMGERPFVCEVCGYAFQKKDHKEKHVRTVHYKERPHCCTRCDSRFGQKSDLSKHIRTVHDRVKPFACEHCGLSFGHRGNKARHVLVVHEKRKPFICKYCSIGFGERSNLAKHIMAVHKQPPDL